MRHMSTTDEALLKELRASVKNKVDVTLIDAYLAKPNFETIVSTLLAILEKAASNNETR